MASDVKVVAGLIRFTSGDTTLVQLMAADDDKEAQRIALEAATTVQTLLSQARECRVLMQVLGIVSAEFVVGSIPKHSAIVVPNNGRIITPQ